MSDKNREDILKKVRGLAEMANPENGAFPGEIANASALMQKLMDQYQIQWDEVMLSKIEQQTKRFEEASAETIIGSLKKWHWALGRVIGRITGTRHFAHSAYGKTVRDPNGKNKRGHHMSFFGTGATPITASQLYARWVVLIDDMAKKATSEYCKALKEEMEEEMIFQGVKDVRHLTGLENDHPNVWRNSWLEGVIAGMDAALREQEKSRTTETSNALMVIGKEVTVAYKEFSQGFKTMHTSSRIGNSSAFDAGHVVGKNLNLNQSELGAGAKRLGG